MGHNANSHQSNLGLLIYRKTQKIYVQNTKSGILPTYCGSILIVVQLYRIQKLKNLQNMGEGHLCNSPTVSVYITPQLKEDI